MGLDESHVVVVLEQILKTNQCEVSCTHKETHTSTHTYVYAQKATLYVNFVMWLALEWKIFL